ncbi:CapA family protein [Kitasatospora arboriphila]
MPDVLRQPPRSGRRPCHCRHHRRRARRFGLRRPRRVRRPVRPGRPLRLRRGRGTITVAFAGDVHFEGRTASRLAGGPDTALGPISRTLAAADLAVLNLETAITGRGAPEPKTYTFRTSPKALQTLRDAGVDVVSLANNHAVDFGAAASPTRSPPRPPHRSRSSASAATPRRRTPRT